MKALVRKDIYVLWKQMRIFIFVLIVMSAVNSSFNSVFVVVWTSLLPYTAMAYDERSHWDQLAAMMPYSRRDIVLSKYVLGWLCIAASAVLCLVVQTGAFFLSQKLPDVDTLAVAVFGGVIAIAVTLPMVFRFGVERGRMVFMVIMFGIVIASGLAAGVIEELQRVPLPAMALAPVAAAAATAVSIPLSVKLYRTE